MDICKADFIAANRENESSKRSGTDIKIVVAQKGIREDFLAARALYRQGMLAELVVDWYPPLRRKFANYIERFTRGTFSRAFRYPSDELPRQFIKPLYATRLRAEVRRRLSRPKSLGDRFLKDDRDFAVSVAKRRWPEHDAFFGYSYASLEALEFERSSRKFCILDQIDPGEKEHEIIAAEERRWSSYVSRVSHVSRPYFERLKGEWRAAHVILVNSEWSRDCIIEKGAPTDKIEVVPLAYELDNSSLNATRTFGKPARILWVGRVTLQKGIQYLIEAARLLRNDAVEIIVCGATAVTQEAVLSAPKNMRWLGKVSHAEKMALFHTATAFVLPTLSDGFGLTQLEALACGLPVIVTPNCGRVVEDGVTGFVVPPRDPDALAQAIKRFVRQPTLAATMSASCREVARRYSVSAYGQNLTDIIMRYRRLSCSAKPSELSGIDRNNIVGSSL